MKMRDVPGFHLNDKRKLCELLSVFVLVFASFFIFTFNNDFALGLHIDEPHKVLPVIRGENRFTHPQLLMLLMKLVFWVGGDWSPQELVEAGRVVAALFGSLLVLFTYLLARRLQGPVFAMLAGALVATSPLIAVHSHYLKEDIFLAPFFVGGLWAYLRLEERPSGRGIVLLGVLIGLAVSAKLVGALLVVALVCVALFFPGGDRRGRLRIVAMATAIGALLGVAINHAVLLEPGLASAQLSSELRHGIVGHTLQVWPIDTFFAYHFLNSLVPGLSWPVAFFFIVGLLSGLIPALRFSRAETIVLIALGVFYLAHEISPTKPWPASIRYMVPVAPLVVIFALKGVFAPFRLKSRLKPRRWMPPAIAVCLALIVLPAAQSVSLIRNLKDDTRLRVRGLTARHMAEIYSYFGHRSGKPANQIRIGFAGATPLKKIVKSGAGFLLLSSFAYGRFMIGKTLAFQPDRVYRIAERYEKLLACPGRTIAPRYRSFGFSNPTIRIVDLRKCAALAKGAP